MATCYAANQIEQLTVDEKRVGLAKTIKIPPSEPINLATRNESFNGSS